MAPTVISNVIHARSRSNASGPARPCREVRVEFKREGGSLALTRMGNFTSLLVATSRNIVYWKTAGGGVGVGDRDWSSLPDELLGSIVERLPMPDHARARTVCASWASVASSAVDYPPSTSHFPWLMLDTHSFLSLSDGRSYRFCGTDTKKCSSTAAACVGSRDGCLAIVETDTSVSSYLINPVTGARTELPSFSTLPWSKTFFDVRKIVFASSTAASARGFVVAAALVYSLSCCYLAFARPGDEGWTPLDFSCPPSQRIEDVVVHRDRKLYAVFTRGRVQAFDLHAASPEASRVYGTCTAADVAPVLHSSRHVHLVSSSSSALLRVESEKEVLTGATTRLSVARLDVESDAGWTGIRDLGGQSLFLDDRCSFSLSAGDDVRKNCVHFVDRVPHSGEIRVGDLRTFDVEKGVIARLRPSNSRIDGRRLMAPVWFVPSLS